jgi:hypothetical protein
MNNLRKPCAHLQCGEAPDCWLCELGGGAQEGRLERWINMWNSLRKKIIFLGTIFFIRLEISLVESLRSRLLVFEVCLEPALINIGTGKILKAVIYERFGFDFVFLRP